MENLFILIDELISYEKKTGIKFNDKGYPIFENKMFYSGNINRIIPYDHRNEATHDDLICFYAHDICMYRKLTFKKLSEVSKELNNFSGFIGFDLSLFTDMPILTEEFYLLANLVINMYFIINGNLLVPNLRYSKIKYFDYFNKAPIVACGTLGCSKNKSLKIKNKELLTNYLQNNENQKVILYGSKLISGNNVIHKKSYGRKKDKNG